MLCTAKRHTMKKKEKGEREKEKEKEKNSIWKIGMKIIQVFKLIELAHNHK